MASITQDFALYLARQLRQLADFTHDSSWTSVAKRVESAGDRFVLEEPAVADLAHRLTQATSDDVTVSALLGNSRDLLNRLILAKEAIQTGTADRPVDAWVPLHHFIPKDWQTLHTDWHDFLATLKTELAVTDQNLNRLVTFLNQSGLGERETVGLITKQNLPTLLAFLENDAIFEPDSLLAAAFYHYLDYVCASFEQAIWHFDENNIVLLDRWTLSATEHKDNAWVMSTDTSALKPILAQISGKHPEHKITNLEILFVGDQVGYANAQKDFRKVVRSKYEDEGVISDHFGNLKGTKAYLTHYRSCAPRPSGPTSPGHKSGLTTLAATNMPAGNAVSKSTPPRGHSALWTHTGGMASTARRSAPNNALHYRRVISGKR